MTRRDDEHILRKVLRMVIPGKRKTGRSKTGWKDACQRDMKRTGLRAGKDMDRAMWSRKIISYTVTLYDEKPRGEEVCEF